MKISEYFNGKEILVTGATGLMGKALVEKLLRSCPGVSKIYVIIRAKRGCEPRDRWNKTIQSPLYDNLRKTSPDSLSKVVVMAGDGGKDNFGLNEQDRELLIENVNIVYNFAASINFFNNVTRALEMNLKSTHSLLELGRKMEKLECFIHVSTTYCHFTVKGVIKEKVYESHLDWRTMLELIKDENQSSALQMLEPKILGGHLTTYTLTKAMAEIAVRDYNKYFPTIIVRPAVVGGTAKDPIPGWMDVDNFVTLYGRGVHMGVIRVLPLSTKTPIEMIPLDVSVKGMMIATWKRSIHSTDETEVYCHRVEDKYRLEIGNLNALKFLQRHPSPNTLWYNYYFYVSNPTLYAIGYFFFHVISGFFIDVALNLLGQNHKYPRLKKVYTDIWQYNSLSQYFENPHHVFDSTNFAKLEALVPEEDKQDFSVDYSDYDKMKNLEATTISVMKYAWKENFDDKEIQEKAKRRYKMLTILHYTLCTVVLLVLVKWLWSTSTTLRG